MKIYHQSVFERWTLPDKSCQLLATSPPYWSLRKYDIPDVVIGGDKDCNHEWGETKNKTLNLQAGNPEFKREWRREATQTINNGSFCLCGAWKGQYGLEPTFGSVVEYDTDEMELKEDLTNDDRKFVLSELLKRGIIA